MMMLPPITCSPPNFLTPRRRPAESRPLRDEPPAFLCAIALYLLNLGFGGRRCGLRRRSGPRRLHPLLIADRGDLQDGVILTMAVAAAIIVTTALLEHDD